MRFRKVGFKFGFCAHFRSGEVTSHTHHWTTLGPSVGDPVIQLSSHAGYLETNQIPQVKGYVSPDVPPPHRSITSSEQYKCSYARLLQPCRTLQLYILQQTRLPHSRGSPGKSTLPPAPPGKSSGSAHQLGISQVPVSPPWVFDYSLDYQFITKDTKQQPDEEIHRERSQTKELLSS